jgi:hypothetical protein
MMAVGKVPYCGLAAHSRADPGRVGADRDGSGTVGIWLDTAKMAVGMCLTVDWPPIAGPTPGKVGAAGAGRHSAPYQESALGVWP